MKPFVIALLGIACALAGTSPAAEQPAATLHAGAAKVDITHPEARTGDPLFVKALVLTAGETTSVIITVDAVAIGGIGSIGDGYLPAVREQLERELGIPPASLLVNASHCHGRVCADVGERTVRAVTAAWRNRVPVKAGAGTGGENQVMENRRLVLKSGRQADVRHAYALPPDDQVVAVGPVDPEIGVLRLDRLDGRPLALVYNFAMHPIQGIPSGGNTADVTGFASKVIEDNLGEGVVALFLQGCGGDINPVQYKDVNNPRDAEPLGNLLGLSTLRAARAIETRAAAPLRHLNERIRVPRANHAARIAELNDERDRLLKSLRGTSLNLATFLQLQTRYQLNSGFPSYSSHRYLHDELIGREDLRKLDAENRANLEKYIRNVHTMEELTRLLINKALLEKHQERNLAAGMAPLEVEVVGLRVGEFRLVTFPGELTVQIGLNLKQKSPHELTFVAGYSNGYHYYCPTAEQLKNVGRAQEDSDCLLAPEWQAIFEGKAVDLLRRL